MDNAWGDPSASFNRTTVECKYIWICCNYGVMAVLIELQ